MPSKRDLDKEKMFRKIMPSSAAPEGGDAVASEGGKLSQDAIASLFAQQEAGVPMPEPQTPRPPIEPPANGGNGGKLSQDTIAALFSQQVADDVPEPESDPEVIALDSAAGGGAGKMSQDAIAALFAQKEPEPAPAAPPAQPAAPVPVPPAPETAQPAEPAPQKAPKLDIAGMYAQQHAKTLAEGADTGDDFDMLDDEIEAAFQGTPVPKRAPEPQPPAQAPAAAAPPPVVEEPLAAPRPAVAAPPPPPVQPPVPAATQAPLPQPYAENAAVHREAPVPKPAPPAFDEAPYPVNLAEVVAELYYPRYQQKFNGCHCDKCRDDVLGMALNRVKPHYITNDQMDPALLQDRTLITECVTAMIRALFVVKRSPKHDSVEAMRRG